MEDFNDSFFDSDFSDNGSDTFETPSPAPAPASETQAQPAVDPAKYQELEQKVQAFEKYQQEVTRFADTLAGRQAQQQDDPNAIIQKMLANPAQYEQSIVQQATARAAEQFALDNAINQARTSHPHLAQFEAAIHTPDNVQEAIANFVKTNGRQPANINETVQAAVQNFEKKLQGWQQTAAQQQTANNLKGMAMNLSVSHDQATQGKTTVQQIAAMGPEELAKFRSQALSGTYL